MTTPIPPAAPTLPGSQPSNPNRKLFIIIGIVILVLCLGACAAVLLIGRGLGGMVQNSVVEDPQKTADLGKEIADFTLPRGYEPRSGIEMLGMKMAMYSGDSNSSMIMLMEVPGADSVEDMDMTSLREQMERQMGRRMSNVRIIDQYQTTIRGKPAQVIIQEGTSENNVETRMLIAIFEGKGGLSMMMIASDTSDWDQNMATKVVKSIK